MLIYFFATTSQSQTYQQSYMDIIHTIEKLGHKVLYEPMEEDTRQQQQHMTAEERQSFYRRFMQQINKCDMVVAEVSYPSSINIGYRISIALEKNKPVLALHAKDKASPFLDGNTSERFLYEEYTPATLRKTIERALNFAEQHTDARFNFFISPRHINFLDFISRKRKIPKSVYLRELIERDRQANHEYKESQS
ncbi:hypothetical protein H3C70_05295 [Patescibacteria group bacterium]|nr:hypothetical protein [Patescibacteria group bacterium]